MTNCEHFWVTLIAHMGARFYYECKKCGTQLCAEEEH